MYNFYNLTKIKFNEDEKKELQRYKKNLLSYLEILDEFDADSACKKTEHGISPGYIKK